MIAADGYAGVLNGTMGQWDDGTFALNNWKVLNVTKSKVTMSISTPMSPKAAKRESEELKGGVWTAQTA